MTDASGLTHQVDTDGILHVVFDRPDAKVNLLDADVLTALADVLDRARDREDIRAVLFRSAKPKMFIAGMDVDQIAEVTDPVIGAEGAREGQAVFQRIEDLRKPSAVAIGGPCVGGGCELALACTFRVAGDDPAVRIGLPEVRLGIIPGFGGSQRLPRLVGLPRSLELILSGKLLDPRRARKAGIVDLVTPQAYVEREARALLLKALSKGVGRTVASLRRKRPIPERLMASVGPLRRYVLEQARKKTAEKASPKHYPAPFQAIEAIGAAVSRPHPEGFEFEARIVGELVPTPTSKNLIWLFKSQTALKSESSGTHAEPRRIRKIGVLGAGIMGGGIAQLAADREIPVRLRDIRYDAILTALRTARSVWGRRLKRRSMTEREVAQKMGFIAPGLDTTGFLQTDIVIEAVVENLDIKQKVLAEIERQIDTRTVFASNTSSLPIHRIGAGALHPERVVGLHFFNPVDRMPLVEVIAAEKSSAEAVATAHALALRLGKVPVIVSDTPGFLVNRILMPYLTEAIRLLSEGVRIQTIDETMTAFGMPMGPLDLMDQIGLDTAAHVGEVLREAFGERLEGDATGFEAMIGSERLGRKNGRGFYRYKNGKRTTPDEEVYKLFGSPAPSALSPETLEERMVLAMVNEAAICIDERVARSARDLDMAMIMGTGFPPFRGGILRHADTIGIPIIADRLSRLADAHGRRFAPSPGLQEMVRNQRRFHDQSTSR